MTEPADPLPPPLEYASPLEDRPSASRMVIQAIVGCTLTCGLLMGAVLFGVLFVAASGTAGVAALGILLGVALLGSTIALAVGTARNPMRRGVSSRERVHSWETRPAISFSPAASSPWQICERWSTSRRFTSAATEGR